MTVSLRALQDSLADERQSLKGSSDARAKLGFAAARPVALHQQPATSVIRGFGPRKISPVVGDWRFHVPTQGSGMRT
jgi:hypothetical protein